MQDVERGVREGVACERLCPVCSSEARKPLFTQQFSAMSSGSLMTSYDVVVCRGCGFAYADRVPGQAAFDAHYRDMSKYEHQHRGGEESPHDLARFRANADLISRFIPFPDARILDIGCSTGRLLSLIKEHGFPNVMGLDPSPACAEAAQRLYGIPVLTGALSDVLAEEEPFDFLILAAVLEHIRDLAPIVTKLRKMLSSEGRVFVEVPDATRFADYPDAPFQQFSTEHINFFSPTSLANLMQANGFVQLFHDEGAHEQSHGTMMPVVGAVFEAGDRPRTERDTETEKKLAEYIRQSRAVEDRLQQIIADIADSGRPIIVWGVGTHTLRLLETSRLADANICCFVDSNVRYQGKRLRGIPIIPPDELKQRTEPVLISSRVFQREIERQIRDDLNCGNELITLYEL